MKKEFFVKLNFFLFLINNLASKINSFRINLNTQNSFKVEESKTDGLYNLITKETYATEKKNVNFLKKFNK